MRAWRLSLPCSHLPKLKKEEFKIVKIKMKTLAASPDGIYHVDEIIDLPDDEAHDLIDGGYAELIEVGDKKDNANNAKRNNKKSNS